MSKPTKSLMGSKTAKATADKPLTELYISPEILQMRMMEAREWTRRYKAKASEDGAAQAKAWWLRTIADIERIRGYDQARLLERLIREQK